MLIKKYLTNIALLYSCLFLWPSCKNEPKNESNLPAQSNDSVLTLLNQKLAGEPDNITYLSQRSEYYQNSGRFKDALADIEKAYSIDSAKALIAYKYADLLFLNGNLNQSGRMFQKCLQIDENYTEARMKLSEFYLYKKEFENAIKEANLVIEKDKLNKYAWFQRGMILKGAGDTVRSIESFQRALEIAPDYYEPSVQLGIIYGFKLNPIAFTYYDKALKLKPGSTEAIYGKALLQQELNQIPEAIKTYQSLIQTDSTFFNAYYNLGFVYAILQQDYRQGSVYFGKALHFNPKYADAAYMKGLCFENLGEYAKAGRDYTHALEIDNQHKFASEGLQRIQKK